MAYRQIAVKKNGLEVSNKMWLLRAVVCWKQELLI